MSLELSGTEEITTHRPPAATSSQVGDITPVVALAAARTWRERALLMMLFAFSISSIAGWWLLVRDWGVIEHHDAPFFSFEKVDGEFDSPILRRAFTILLVIGFAYAGIVAALRSRVRIDGPVRVALALAALGSQVAAVMLYPVGALDVFNYLAEIKLAFHYDQNPYIVTLEAFKADSFATSAFLVDIPLFYGPAWLLVSAIPVVVVGFENALAALLAMKVFHVLVLAAIAVMIGVYQRDERAGWVAAAIFFLNPLIVFEGVANVHNDVLMTLFIVAAMVSLQRRSLLAGPLLALAVLVKLYAAALAPLFIAVALRNKWPWRRAVGTAVLALLTMIAVSLPYWADGRMIDGFESGLEQSQFMDHVSVFSLVQQYEQQKIAEKDADPELIRSRPSHEILPEETADSIRSNFMKIFVGTVLALAIAAWKGRAPEIVAGETLLLLMLFTTNLYAWYLIPVIALFAMRRDRLSMVYIVVATILGLAYYPMYVFAHYNTDWHRFDVHLFLSLFLTVPILLYLLARTGSGIWIRTRSRVPVA